MRMAPLRLRTFGMSLSAAPRASRAGLAAALRQRARQRLATFRSHARCARGCRAAKFQPPLVAARGAREGLWLEQKIAGGCARRTTELPLGGSGPDCVWQRAPGPDGTLHTPV